MHKTLWLCGIYGLVHDGVRAWDREAPLRSVLSTAVRLLLNPLEALQLARIN
jgi:hypothetical protein